MVLRAEDAFHIEAHGLAQIVFHQAEHLVRLVDLDGPLFEPVMLAQSGDDAGVNTGGACGPEIYGDAIGLFVAKRRLQPFPAGHDMSAWLSQIVAR